MSAVLNQMCDYSLKYDVLSHNIVACKLSYSVRFLNFFGKLLQNSYTVHTMDGKILSANVNVSEKQSNSHYFSDIELGINQKSEGILAG